MGRARSEAVGGRCAGWVEGWGLNVLAYFIYGYTLVIGYIYIFITIGMSDCVEGRGSEAVAVLG